MAIFKKLEEIMKLKQGKLYRTTINWKEYVPDNSIIMFLEDKKSINSDCVTRWFLFEEKVFSIKWSVISIDLCEAWMKEL